MSKSEIRNKFKTQIEEKLKLVASRLGNLDFGHLRLFRISDFDIRVCLFLPHHHADDHEQVHESGDPEEKCQDADQEAGPTESGGLLKTKGGDEAVDPENHAGHA